MYAPSTGAVARTSATRPANWSHACQLIRGSPARAARRRDTPAPRGPARGRRRRRGSSLVLRAAANDPLAARDEERCRREERDDEREEEKIAHGSVVPREARGGALPDATATRGKGILTPSRRRPIHERR